MEAIPVNEADVVRMETVANGVHGLRIVFVNVFAIDGNVGWTLVDAGLGGSAGYIQRWAEQQVSTSPPTSIVLTHGHFDHVGALEELARRWSVPVYVHPEELPYVTGDRDYPPPDPTVGGGMMARLSVLYPRGSARLEGDVRLLPADGSVPHLAEWRWIHTPGHSAGHVSLFRERDRTLIVGDAFCTTKQESFLAAMSQRPELHGPPAYFTTDWDAARASVERLAALRPLVVAPGHGRPLQFESSASGLQELASRFDEVAVPRQGRYVDGVRS